MVPIDVSSSSTENVSAFTTGASFTSLTLIVAVAVQSFLPFSVTWTMRSQVCSSSKSIALPSAMKNSSEIGSMEYAPPSWPETIDQFIFWD